MRKWTYLFFFSIYSVFLYRRFIDANIGPWSVETGLKISQPQSYPVHVNGDQVV